MKINKSNIVKGFCIIILLGTIAMSCRQDPIFYIISSETAPVPPRISGSPTNMVVFERTYLSDPADPDSEKSIPLLFVASGILHWYGRPPDTGEPPSWDRSYGIPQPMGRIISLAVTKDRLYALCLNGDSLIATLQYMGHTGGWNIIPGISSLQSIYADPETDRLFVSAGSASINNTIAYSIYYLDLKDDTLKLLRNFTAMLSGAAYRKGTYYLCTRGAGIFQVTETDLAADLPISTPLNNFFGIPGNLMSFMGMIKLKDPAESIITIDRTGGSLYEILENEQGVAYFSPMYYYIGTSVTITSYAIGGLALWEDASGFIKKLVVSRQGTLYSTSYNNGYTEFYLNSYDGSFDKGNPIYYMDTVSGYSDRYSTSLGKLPINHLFQAPREIDPEMTFFASTQTAGLWSYRYRPFNGGWQWNSEE